jgi:hypothetical protein
MEANETLLTAADPGRIALSDQLEQWLDSDDQRTLGSLVDAFEEKSFAILLVVLLAIPALPIPTAGVTHIFELIGALVALELIAGRREVWLPARWRKLTLAGDRQQRFIERLMQLVRWLERHSRPRFVFFFHRRLSDALFGVMALVGIAGAFLAPPFTGLDTLPSLGVVALSLGFLLEDVLIVGAGMVLGAVGVALELTVGSAAVQGISSLV